MQHRIIKSGEWDCWNEKPGQLLLYHGVWHISVDAGDQGTRLAAIKCPKEAELIKLREASK